MRHATPRGIVQLRIASIEQILDLRHRILRAGLPLETARFDGDELPTTLHVAATAEDRVIACASFVQRPLDGEPAWQLRGMAVEEGWRSAGVGARLLAFGEAELCRRDGVRLLWCNARVPALRFYQRLGWQVISEPFDVPTAGPHVRMSKRLTQPPPAGAV